MDAISTSSYQAAFSYSVALSDRGLHDGTDVTICAGEVSLFTETTSILNAMVASLHYRGPEREKEMGMVGVLLVKPLLLLGGAGYLAFRFLQKTVTSPQDGKEEQEFTRTGGIEMTLCAKCGMYTRSDAAQCPCCSESKDSASRSG